MPRILRTLVLVFFLSISLTSAYATNSVLVTLKLVKRDGVSPVVPYTVNLPAVCAGCSVLEDPEYVKQNAREIVLAVRLQRSTEAAIRVVLPPDSIRRVLLEGMDLPFVQRPDGLQFVIPPQPVDAPNAGEVQTHILWPGVDLRFEHGDVARRSGDYATGSWPARQLEAAHTLEFAQLEALRMLGLDTFVASKNIGTIDLMGFDTNDPHGHRDSPPHMHMILWWPTVRGTGSLVAHYYLSAQGLLTHALVGQLGAPGLSPTRFKPGEMFTDTDLAGEAIYTHTITAEGWLRMGRVGGGSCLMRPISSGFDGPVSVECLNFPPLTVTVRDDLERGQITETINLKQSNIFTYDRDSGSLLGMSFSPK